MKIYEKIIRRLKNTNWGIASIMNKETIRKIKKDIKTLETEKITFGIEPLTTENLTDFYQNIYVPIIGNKNNAKVHNLLEKIEIGGISDNNRFLIFIRNGNTLLGGWICNYIHNKLRFNYKCNTKEPMYLKAWFWKLIDFLFFSFWIEKSVEYFTYWMDRNWYWGIWAMNGLCRHKLLLWFIPYSSPKNIMIEIDEQSINTPTIIFDEPNEKEEFKKVVLLHREDKTDNYIEILTKKWFNITHI